MSIGLKSDSSGTSGSIVINGSDKIVVTSAGNVTAGTFTGAVVGAVTGNVTGNVTGSLTAGGSITSGVAVASTSGTAIDFTSIPSWAKRVTVIFGDVSTSGGNHRLVQIGTSGGIQSTGYTGVASYAGSSVGSVTSTAGFVIFSNDGANIHSGLLVLVLVDQSNGMWAASGCIAQSNNSFTMQFAGAKTLSGTLDRVRITTAGATDTFDAGSINIIYEG